MLKQKTSSLKKPNTGGKMAFLKFLFEIYLPRPLEIGLPWLATPWTAAHQAPLPKGFSSKNIGVGCHALLQGTPQPRDGTCIPCLALSGGFFTTRATWEALLIEVV